MDKKLIQEHREVMAKRRTVGLVVVAAMVVLGAIAILAPILAYGPILQLVDDEHMTDDGIAYRDLDNATYTYTAEELLDMVRSGQSLTVLGAGIVASSYIAFIIVGALTPSKTKDHKRYCDIDPTDMIDAKYCSECGLKLSELDKG